MKYCPRCLRTEADIPGCPNEDFPGMTCPDPVDENPAKDVSISCGPCDFNRIVPVRELLSGAAKNKLPTCRRDECACVIVPPEAASVAEVVPNPVMPELAAFAEKAAELAPIAPAQESAPPVAPEPAKVGKGKKAKASASSAEETLTPETEAADPVATPSEGASEDAPAEDIPGLPTSE